MKKILFFMMSFLLIIISAGCSKDDDSNAISHHESCISGQVSLFNSESAVKDYVCIVGLKMPENDDKYNYINAVVVLKDELPSKYHHNGTAIDFNIVEVKHVFPPAQTGPQEYPGNYFCSIELCK